MQGFKESFRQGRVWYALSGMCVFAGMYEFDLVLLLLQQMCVFLVIAWLMSKNLTVYPPDASHRSPAAQAARCYVTFSISALWGTYFGLAYRRLDRQHPRHRRRDGRPVGGPVVGGLVGLTGGLHRYSLGE